VADGRLLGSDLGEKGILQLMDGYAQTRIVATPIGGNGFLFGRGNRQFTPQVLRRVGRAGLIVVATSDKADRSLVRGMIDRDLLVWTEYEGRIYFMRKFPEGGGRR
jgi:predicted polyphosphate/ATP-dependent NAD kinase